MTRVDLSIRMAMSVRLKSPKGWRVLPAGGWGGKAPADYAARESVKSRERAPGLLRPAACLACGDAVAGDAMRKLAAILAASACLANGAAKAEDRAIVSLVFENDFFGGTDQGYTNGLKVAWLSPDGRGRALARLFLRADADDAVRFGVAAGQSIFTPQDTGVAAPLPGQHPYAGWLYLEATSIVERATPGGRSGPIDIFKLFGGVVGPASLAEEAQRTAHRLVNVDDVLGWDNQLRNEPGFMASFDRIWRPLDPGSGFGVDLLPHAGVTAGNVITEARGGATIRIGTRLPSNYGQTRIAPATPGAGFHSAHGFSWQIHAGAEARGVARKIFLDGNSFRDSLSVDKKNFVGEFQAGFAVQTGRFQLAYTHVFRSREFKNQNDRLDFGSLTLSAAF